MTRKHQALAKQASSAGSAEQKFAAMVTLEAVEPEGSLADPEVILLAADHLDGDKLAVELDKAEKLLRQPVKNP